MEDSILSIANGVWPTMITPYLDDGSIDFNTVERMVDWYVEKKCDGVFAVCQSSEMFFLSLEERVQLGKTVKKAVDGRVQVIVSGHISADERQQYAEIEAMGYIGADAVVLVSNRFAEVNENDLIWIERASKLVEYFPEITFGIYECPYPYKRVLTPQLIEWCARGGRFSFLKDTCCHAGLIRNKLLTIQKVSTKEGTEPLKLFNANTMTLLESIRDGASGFSGVMANFHPELYRWLYDNYQTEPQKAEQLQALLTLLSSLEEQGYPICAKQHMYETGIPMLLHSRSMHAAEFGYAQRETLRQSILVEQLARELCHIF